MPFFLSVGMSPTDFWEGDLSLTRAYMKKAKLDEDRRNFELWLQGAYIHHAFSAVMATAFSKKSEHYAEEPYTLRDGDRKKKNRDRAKASLMAFAAAHNAAHREES